eukprot:c17542_g1_i1.p1 GENE.c17542_g1_i1~~c17542_g1_i1.p1  ORF type:complete len:218 (+),score=40.91 c17542_g1_i1:281-934(+)
MAVLERCTAAHSQHIRSPSIRGLAQSNTFVEEFDLLACDATSPIPLRHTPSFSSTSRSPVQQGTAQLKPTTEDADMPMRETFPEMVTPKQAADLRDYTHYYLVGSVKAQHCVFVDNIVSSPLAICAGIDLARSMGCGECIVTGVHGALTPDGSEALRNMGDKIMRVVLSNSHPTRNFGQDLDNLDVLDVSWLFAEAMRRIFDDQIITQEGTGVLSDM